MDDNRQYLLKVPVDWDNAIIRLSSEAFYMLNVIYRLMESVTDESIRDKTGNGLSKHRKIKKELIVNSYLSVEQVGKSKFKYIVGDIDE